MNKTLLVVRGFPGAGKSTLAYKFAEKHNFALIKQDTFVFGLNPGSMIKRVARLQDRKLGFANMLAVMENYMKAKKPIVLEGALVAVRGNEPFEIEKFFALAEKYGYAVKLVTLVADERVRKRRQRKRGYVLSRDLDRHLVEQTNEQSFSIPNLVINTSKMNEKKSLAALEAVL